MAALEGFELTVDTGNVSSTAGLVNETHVDGDTALDPTGLTDGTVYVCVPEAGGSLSVEEEVPDGSVAVGSATHSSGTVSAVSYEHRGRTAPVSTG